MFDPADFRAVATHCRTQSDEAFHRTAIGRFYYSVYMQLDRYVDTWPRVLRRDRGQGLHNKTINALLYVQTTNTGPTVSDLQTLKRLRHKADYDRKYSTAARDSRRAERLARKISSRLDSLESGSPT